MITRAKKNNTNLTWKPFATSTPLRINPEKTKNGLPQQQPTKGKDAKVVLLKKTFETIKNGPSKQIHGQNGQIAKKLKRNRSSFYFRVPSPSSSEDDDSCLSTNGPTIKINLEGSTNVKSNLKNGDLKKKSFISPKNSIDESNKIVEENGVMVKSANKRSFNKEISANGKSTENGKPEVISTSKKLDYGMKLSLRSQNINNSSEKKHKENSLKEKKTISKDESNNNSKNSKESKSKIVNLNGCEPNCSTESSILDLVPKGGCGKPRQQQKISPKSKKNASIKSQNSSLSDKDVSNTRKRTQPMTNADSEKEIEKKRVKNAKEHTPDNEPSTNKNKSQLKIKSFRKDASHQLFSDSMHEELINSLDLTNVELDVLDLNQKHILSSPWKLTPKKSLPKNTKLRANAIKNINNSQIEETKRSVRQRQQPREFWMPKIQCDLPNTDISVSKEKPENEVLKANTNSWNIKRNSKKDDAVSASQYPHINVVQNKKGDVLNKEEGVNSEYNKIITKNDATKSKTKKFGFTTLPNKTNDSKNRKKDENQSPKECNQETKTKIDKVSFNPLATNFSDVFKQLNQLPTFENYVDGIQTAECWSLKNFKCGVLKVRKQCEVSDKTSFKNSYFGGILIKGSLKMKIGNKDLEINQGDMAFVPPLTEWCVIGTHESESLFYYWCGRFRT